MAALALIVAGALGLAYGSFTYTGLELASRECYEATVRDYQRLFA